MSNLLTREKLINRIYAHQRDNCRKRGYEYPEYSNKEFKEFLLSSSLFNSIYNKWVESGMKKDLTPSIDRLDDYKTYSFDNISLTTWKENKEKSHRDRLNGVNNKASYEVSQYDKQGNYITTYFSASEANRVTSTHIGNLLSVCHGLRKSAGGFIWKFTEGGLNV